MMANTTARPARTSVEASRRIARDYGTRGSAGRPTGSGGGSEVRALQVLEDPRPFDRLCKNNIRAGLTGARDERLSVAGHNHHPCVLRGLRQELSDEHVARDVGQ